MTRPRVLRVAELIQAEDSAVRAAVAELPNSIAASVSVVQSGVLLTLEHRRGWWDRRPRRVILSSLARRLDGIVSATSRVVIVGAAIERHGLVLAGQRAHPIELRGKWEFPGGKVELGESPVTALVRECIEELGCRVVVGAEVGRVQLPTGACLIVFRAVLADAAQEPTASEHLELRWCAPAELTALDWLDHDVEFARTLAHCVHRD